MKFRYFFKSIHKIKDLYDIPFTVGLIYPPSNYRDYKHQPIIDRLMIACSKMRVTNEFSDIQP